MEHKGDGGDMSPLVLADTLESEINVPLRLLIFGIFSRGYGLITDLKELNFTT